MSWFTKKPDISEAPSIKQLAFFPMLDPGKVQHELRTGWILSFVYQVDFDSLRNLLQIHTLGNPRPDSKIIIAVFTRGR